MDGDVAIPSPQYSYCYLLDSNDIHTEPTPTTTTTTLPRTLLQYCFVPTLGNDGSFDG